MRYAGIDIASERHVVAVIGDDDAVLVRPSGFGEDSDGYTKLLALLGPPEGLTIAMEATGHYWRNLFSALASAGYSVALLNPRRTHAFAAESLERTKTDEVDALLIARFAREKRVEPSRLREPVLDELRELVRLRQGLTQAFGDKVRELHRLVDLCFPELTRHVKTLDSLLAAALLERFPTAQHMAKASPTKLARLVYDGRHKVGPELANALIGAARRTVGAHHGPVYEIQVRFTCEDLATLRRRLADIEADVEKLLSQHELGSLLRSIDGLGMKTVSVLLAEVGDPALFKSAKALAAYVGCVPALRMSGKSRARRAPLTSTGNHRLRRALYMPTLTAVRHNPWLKVHYDRLVASGKPKKVALLACMNKLMHAVHSVSRNRTPFQTRTADAAT